MRSEKRIVKLVGERADLRDIIGVKQMFGEFGVRVIGPQRKNLIACVFVIDAA